MTKKDSQTEWQHMAVKVCTNCLDVGCYARVERRERAQKGVWKGSHVTRMHYIMDIIGSIIS